MIIRNYLVILSFLLSILPVSSEAHSESDPTWGQEMIHGQWNFDPVVIFGLILLLSGYIWSVYRYFKFSPSRRGLPSWRVGCFIAGFIFLVLALISPMDSLSDDLGFVHMVQHKILLTVASPLIVLALPSYIGIWAIPLRTRKIYASLRQTFPATFRQQRNWIGVLAAWLTYGAVLWIWHWPDLYELALQYEFVHYIQHLSFFIAACIFWRALFEPLISARLHGPGVLVLFLTSLHASMLAVYMTLSRQVWYPTYKQRTSLWNISPIEDQQMAGLIMWMPACLIYAGIAVLLFVAWMQQPGGQNGARSKEIYS